MNKTIQAKHVPEERLLRAIVRLGQGRPSLWVNRWDLEQDMKDFPYKVVIAKVRSLVKRGLVEGCTCGCRGDFYLTTKGQGVLS